MTLEIAVNLCFAAFFIVGMVVLVVILASTYQGSE